MTEALIDLSADPFALFSEWMALAEDAEPVDANAMTVATASADGVPSARTLLLKGFGRDGFVFYTNLGSPKARELEANPRAALLFYWKSLGRQVRICGSVSLVTAKEADRYFASRSRMSRLGAIASEQSQPLADRAVFEQRLTELAARYEDPDAPIPRPENWGGYRLSPQSFEFWQERPHRLHDRAVWLKNAAGQWDTTRLYP